MKTIHFVGGDRKARQFVQAINQRGGKAQALKAYPFTAWLTLMRPDKVEPGDVVVVRYLNDNPSLFLSLLKPIGDLLTLAVVRIRKVRLLWLCHNVDRETETYWPLVSRLRRRVWERYCDAIIVTDPSLMDAANAVFYKARSKITPITLGALPKDRRFSRPDDERRARRFLRSPDAGEGSGRGSIRVLCAGISGEKYIHFELLPLLDRFLKAAGWSPRVLVVTRFQRNGSWSRGKDYSDFVDWCDKTDSVLLLKDYIDIDEKEWSDDIDLVWRTMSDWSFAFTLINACVAKIPLLSYQSGAVGTIVDRERIGATVSWDFSDLEEKVDAALGIPSKNFEDFLAKRSWDNAARVFMSYAGVADNEKLNRSAAESESS